MTDQTKAPERICVDFNNNGTASVISPVPKILGTMEYIRKDIASEQVGEAYERGIEAAANARGMWFGFNSSGEPTGEYCTVKAHDPGDMKLYISHDAIRAIDVDEVLAGLRPRCAECDCDDGNRTWIASGPDAVARLVEAARAQGCGYPCGYDCNGACFNPQPSQLWRTTND